MSTHQHKSSTSPTRLSFIVLQFHNYCICLGSLLFNLCLLVFSNVINVLFITIVFNHLRCTCIFVPLSFMLCRWHSFHFSPLHPTLLIRFILGTQCLMRPPIINTCVSIHFFVLPSASSLIRDWSTNDLLCCNIPS